MHGRSYYHDSLGTTSRLSGLIEEPASVTTTIIIRSGEIRLRIDLIRAYFPEQGAIALLEATYYPARFQSSIESCFSSWSLDSFSFRFAPRFRHDWIAQFFFLIPYLLFKKKIVVTNISFDISHPRFSSEDCGPVLEATPIEEWI